MARNIISDWTVLDLDISTGDAWLISRWSEDIVRQITPDGWQYTYRVSDGGLLLLSDESARQSAPSPQ